MPDHDPRTVVTIRYRNHRGEISTRRIIPRNLSFCATEWHPIPQWILDAWDVDKPGGMVIRSFALADVLAWFPGSHPVSTSALEVVEARCDALIEAGRAALEELRSFTREQVMDMGPPADVQTEAVIARLEREIARTEKIKTEGYV